jgi:membrane-associated phospholipid phosphatase
VSGLGELEKSVAHYVAAAVGRTAAAARALGRAVTAGELEKSVAHAMAAALRRTAAHVATAVGALGRTPRRAAGRILPEPVPLAAGAAAAIVAVALAMIFVDAWAIEQTRRLPPIVIDTFNTITDFGTSGWFLWPTGLTLLLIAAVATPALGRIANLTLIAVMVRLEFVFFAVAVPGLTFTILKRLIGRARPSALGPFHYVPFSWRADHASLPSGHSTTAFSAAVAIGLLYPRARPALWIYALIIALSRVVIAAHFPSDVIAGAFVGAFGAILVRNYFAVRRRVLTATPDGRFLRWPGPSLRRIGRVAARIAGH